MAVPSTHEDMQVKLSAEPASQSQSPAFAMSSAARPPHEETKHSAAPGALPSRRRHVLAVGDATLAAQLARETERRISSARDFHEALGLLATSDYASAPGVIIATPEAITEDAAEIAANVRRIDPTITILLVADARSGHGGTPAPDFDATGGAGDTVLTAFDGVIAAPIRRFGIERAINEAGWKRATQSADRLPSAPVSQRSEKREIDQKREDAEGGSTARPICCDEPEADDHDSEDALIVEIPHGATGERAGGTFGSSLEATGRGESSPTSSTSLLADVDLVGELLADDREFRRRLIEIVRERSGIADLRLASAPAQEPALEPGPAPGSDGSTATAAVEYRGESLGCLMSATAEEAKLELWARRIGRWLALDRHVADLRELSLTDELTGACNRRYFNQFLSRALDDARARRQPVTLMIFDLDDFKRFNDEYGHTAGDQILVETVKLLKSVIRPGDKVCRIGGDEFAVIFYDPAGQRAVGSQPPQDIHLIARRFQRQIAQHRFPKLGEEAPGALTITGGLATFPWDANDVNSLIEEADRRAMAGKRGGKNVMFVGRDAATLFERAD